MNFLIVNVPTDSHTNMKHINSITTLLTWALTKIRLYCMCAPRLFFSVVQLFLLFIIFFFLHVLYIKKNAQRENNLRPTLCSAIRRVYFLFRRLLFSIRKKSICVGVRVLLFPFCIEFSCSFIHVDHVANIQMNEFRHCGIAFIPTGYFVCLFFCFRCSHMHT